MIGTEPYGMALEGRFSLLAPQHGNDQSALPPVGSAGCKQLKLRKGSTHSSKCWRSRVSMILPTVLSARPR
jgi:hypothetical protein